VLGREGVLPPPHPSVAGDGPSPLSLEEGRFPPALFFFLVRARGSLFPLLVTLLPGKAGSYARRHFSQFRGERNYQLFFFSLPPGRPPPPTITWFLCPLPGPRDPPFFLLLGPPHMAEKFLLPLGRGSSAFFSTLPFPFSNGTGRVVSSVNSLSLNNLTPPFVIPPFSPLSFVLFYPCD